MVMYCKELSPGVSYLIHIRELDWWTLFPYSADVYNMINDPVTGPASPTPPLLRETNGLSRAHPSNLGRVQTEDPLTSIKYHSIKSGVYYCSLGANKADMNVYKVIFFVINIITAPRNHEKSLMIKYAFTDLNYDAEFVKCGHLKIHCRRFCGPVCPH